MKQAIQALNDLRAQGFIRNYAIGGTPVQLIPAYNALVEEAVRGAREIQIEGEPTRIVSVEHLIAILLQTYRGKDKQRVLMLIERGAYEEARLESILRGFDLVERWNDFKERFL